jgi:hypothetical protein
MVKNSQKENLLTSWKEVSQYLGRDTRTCFRWEKKYGLPVHRLDSESGKSRVFAYRDELDEWLQNTAAKKAFSERAFHRVFPWRKVLYIILPLVGAAAIFLLLIKNLSLDEPNDFRIKDSSLIILNEKGKELWQHDTGLENLIDEKEYREHYQFKRNYEMIFLPFLIIKDINLDGHKEVLFSTQTQDETREGELFCFDWRGKVLWRFKAGRQMKYGNKIYSGDYRIAGILIENLDNDEKFKIIILSHQNPDWPCQLAVLNSEGKVTGEYWNSGYFCDLAFVDLDGDGKKEVVAVGINNEYGKGCIVVFEADYVKGCSPQQNADFECQDLAPGYEKYYIILPRTDVDLTENYPVEAINSINVLENGRLSVRTDLSKIYFELSFKLDSPDVILSHFFMNKHAQARLEGKVKSVLNDEYKEHLIKGILYWDGENWSSRPTMNKRSNIK